MKKDKTDIVTRTGYKVFNEDWTCRGKQYTCPGEFEEDVKLNLCESGMHFCTHLLDCFRYYPINPIYHVAEVVSYGDVCDTNNEILNVTDTKMCTNKLKIVEEFSFEEVIDILIDEVAKYVNVDKIPDSSHEEKTVRQKFEILKTHKDNLIQFTHLLNSNFFDNANIFVTDADAEIIVKTDLTYFDFYFELKFSDFFTMRLKQIHFLDFLSLFNSQPCSVQNVANEVAQCCVASFLQEEEKFWRL